MDLTSNHNTTYIRLKAIGLDNKVILPLIRQVDGWLRNHGPEWVVKRIKDLKTLYLQKLAGNPICNNSSSVRMHKDGSPYGPFRPLFRDSRVTATQALNTLMWYSDFRLNHVTKTQWQKFYNSVTSPEPTLHERFDITVTPEQIWSMSDSWNKARYSSINYWTSSDKRAPIISGNQPGLVTKKESDVLLSEHLSVLNSPLGLYLLTRTPTPFVKSCGVSLPKERLLDLSESDYVPSNIVGRIGFIQERGAKLRAVANPYRVFQAALSRLGNALFDFLQTSCPWDCTFDQESGIGWVERKLNSGSTLFSVDLSDATNQFPLTLQMRVLEKLLGNILRKSPGPQNEAVQCLHLFEIISKGRWHVPNKRKDLEAVKAPFRLFWRKGQPLGLYPSFAAFAVTHGIMLDSIERSLGLRDTFVILGDDVCISDASVNSEYRKMLDVLGCPVSETKTLQSNKVAEFAGKIITSDGALPVEKWKPWKPDDCISVVRQYGLKGLKLVPSHFRKLVKDFCSIPDPIGLGLNPEGLPLGNRMSGIIDLFLPKAEQVEIPNYRKIQQFYDLAYAFQPYLIQKHLFSMFGLDESKVEPNRPTPEELLWMEHYNTVIKHGSIYDVPDLVTQMKSKLRVYDLRSKPITSTHEKTFLQFIQETVIRLWMSRN